jgi:hypothetical protein
LCGKLTQPQVARLDGNVYVRGGDNLDRNLLVWSPADNADCSAGFKLLDEFCKLHPEFEAHSLYLDNYSGSVLKSPELKNFELVRDFSAAPSVNTLPPAIQKLLGWPDRASRTPGAFPR